MEVKVDTYVEHMDSERTLINRAYFTMVGLDENDRPAHVPGLVLETEEERAEWGKGKEASGDPDAPQGRRVLECYYFI